MKIDVQIPFGDTPNKNGRMYSTKVVQSIVDKINENANKIFVTSRAPSESSIDLYDVVGFVEQANYYSKDNSLHMTIQTINKNIPCSITTEKEFNNYFSVVPAGTGTLKNGVIEEYNLISFYVVPKQDSAFEKENTP